MPVFPSFDADLATIDSNVDAILVDTNELQGDWVNGGRLDLLLDAVKAKTDNLPVDPADASDITASFSTTDGLITTVDTVVDAIKVSTDALPTDPADASVIAAASSVTDGLVTTVDTVVDGIQTDLSNATDGLGALKALIDIVDTVADGIVTDVGDPSGHTLTNLTAKMGNDTDTVKTRFDTLDTSIAGIGGSTSSESKGNFSYLDAGGEQTIVELTVTDRKLVYGVWLDMSNMTQNGTVKVFYKVDGTNYREVLSETWATSDSDGVFISLMMGVTDDLKVTYTEAADEAAVRTIPFTVVIQEIE